MNQMWVFSVSDYFWFHIEDCSSTIVEIELLSVSWDYFFVLIRGNVLKGPSKLYFLKTYSNVSVGIDLIVSQGKSTFVPSGTEFKINVRTQGVNSISLLAEDTLTRCKSAIISIPLSQLLSSEELQSWVTFRKKKEFTSSVVSSVDNFQLNLLSFLFHFCSSWFILSDWERNCCPQFISRKGSRWSKTAGLLWRSFCWWSFLLCRFSFSEWSFSYMDYSTSRCWPKWCLLLWIRYS